MDELPSACTRTSRRYASTEMRLPSHLYEEAITMYNEARRLAPAPQTDWEASTWVLASSGALVACALPSCCTRTSTTALAHQRTTVTNGPPNQPECAWPFHRASSSQWRWTPVPGDRRADDGAGRRTEKSPATRGFLLLPASLTSCALQSPAQPSRPGRCRSSASTSRTPAGSPSRRPRARPATAW